MMEIPIRNTIMKTRIEKEDVENYTLKIKYVMNKLCAKCAYQSR